jgi:hypothetical protein
METDPVQEELFDLKQDPREQNNFTGNPEYAEILATLRSRCDELRKELR